jgi:hypothetical protein
MADAKFAILSVLRNFDESGRPGPPTPQLAALSRQRMKPAEATICELATADDIKSAGGDSYEITDRGKTALARAERDGLA